MSDERPPAPDPKITALDIRPEARAVPKTVDDAVFDQFAEKDEPNVRLIVPRGSALPAELGPRDWLPLGAIEPSSETAEAVRTRGFAFVRSDAPLPDPGRLKNADAAGS